MNISELIFSQKDGVFLIWKNTSPKVTTSFICNRPNILLKTQVENAIDEGRKKLWTLIGVGYWTIGSDPAVLIESRKTDVVGISLSPLRLSTTLLRLKNLPERERISTEAYATEMRIKWIPHICSLLRKILSE